MMSTMTRIVTTRYRPKRAQEAAVGRAADAGGRYQGQAQPEASQRTRGRCRFTTPNTDRKPSIVASPGGGWPTHA